jgi:HAMP domain-containing protein
VLAYIVARMASAPLQELAAAAEDLGDDLQRDPLPLRGPREVQRAAEAFNAMQHRLQRHLAERRHWRRSPTTCRPLTLRCAWRMSATRCCASA